MITDTILAETLSLPQKGILSLTGGGGKTTLMYRLAIEMASIGKRIVCTTTTKIFPPTPEQAPLVIAAEEDSLTKVCHETIRRWGRVCVARERWDHSKLLGLEPRTIHELMDSGICDWIIIEADGARRLPLKAPGAHEPVIPERTTHVLAVVGLSAIGTPLNEEHVCRSALYSELTGLPLNAPVSARSVADICVHPQGLFKGAPGTAKRWLWLNQADCPGGLEAGKEVVSWIERASSKPELIFLGSAAQTPCIKDIWRRTL